MDDQARPRLCELAAQLYSPHSADELAPVLDELLDQPTLRDLAGYDGSFQAQAAAKRATSELTGRFAGAAAQATQSAHGTGPISRYDADLVVPGAIAAECALLKAIAAHYVMHRAGARSRQTDQRRLLTELVAAVLEPAHVPAWRGAGSDADRLRVVIDQVAQLTDSSAFAWHNRLVTSRG